MWFTFLINLNLLDLFWKLSVCLFPIFNSSLLISHNLPAVVYASNSNDPEFKISLLNILVIFLPSLSYPCGNFSRNKIECITLCKWINMKKSCFFILLFKILFQNVCPFTAFIFFCSVPLHMLLCLHKNTMHLTVPYRKRILVFSLGLGLKALRFLPTLTSVSLCTVK